MAWRQAHGGEAERTLGPVAPAPPKPPMAAGEDEMPRVILTRRQIVLFSVFILSGIAFLYFVLPKLAGVGTTVRRLEGGDKWWIGVGVVLEIASFSGYVVLFRTMFVRGHGRIGWRESYEITMAGLVATRLFAAAGAGGVALTARAVRRSGVARRIVACRVGAFLFLLYAVFMSAVVIFGLGLPTGLFPRGGGVPPT